MNITIRNNKKTNSKSVLRIIIASEILIIFFFYLAKPLFITQIQQKKSQISSKELKIIERAKKEWISNRQKKENYIKFTKTQAKKLKEFENRKYRKKVIASANEMLKILTKINKLKNKKLQNSQQQNKNLPQIPISNIKKDKQQNHDLYTSKNPSKPSITDSQKAKNKIETYNKQIKKNINKTNNVIKNYLEKFNKNNKYFRNKYKKSIAQIQKILKTIEETLSANEKQNLKDTINNLQNDLLSSKNPHKNRRKAIEEINKILNMSRQLKKKHKKINNNIVQLDFELTALGRIANEDLTSIFNTYHNFKHQIFLLNELNRHKYVELNSCLQFLSKSSSMKVKEKMDILKQMETSLDSIQTKEPGQLEGRKMLANLNNAKNFFSTQIEKTILKPSSAKIATNKIKNKAISADINNQKITQKELKLSNRKNTQNKESIVQKTNKQLLNKIKKYEKEIINSYASLRAQKLSKIRNDSFQKIFNRIQNELSKPEINLQTPVNNSSFKTLAELKQYRNKLNNSVQNINKIVKKAQLIIDMTNPSNTGNKSIISAIQQSRNIINKDSLNTGKEDKEGGVNMQWSQSSSKFKLNIENIKAKAIPGRIIDSNSNRRGWIYVDTWYIIGPWANNGQINWKTKYPPEFNIDLSKTYSNGKDNRTLSWQFFQSDTIRCTPPDDDVDSTYYAYTEIYCENAEKLTVAIASDDAAELFLNDIQTWQDSGLSPWSLDENFTILNFKKGFNTVLLRIENGPGVCQFSLLLCPINLKTSQNK